MLTESQRGWRRSRALALVALLVGTTIVACNQDLNHEAACPVLCPEQNIVVRDTVFEAVSFDTVLSGNPTLGAEQALLLTQRGDTVDTRVVLRFDSLLTRTLISGGDSVVTNIDSAFIKLRVSVSGSKVPAPFVVEAYDVDTTAGELDTAAVLATFSPGRLIGSRMVDTSVLRDSILIPLDNAKLLAKISADAQLRVGLRIVGAKGGTLLIGASNAEQAATLHYDPSANDTAVKPITLALRSDSPVEQPLLQQDLLDYVLVAKAPTARPANTIRVGGLPSTRSFLRFNIPARLLDSAFVIRATLLLTQDPNHGVDDKDSLLVLPQLVLAGNEVTDLERAAGLISLSPVDTLRLAPGDSGVRAFELAPAVASWSSASGSSNQQRAIVFRSTTEGTGPFEVHFFNRNAPAAVRPRLRVSYVIRNRIGIP